MIERKLLKGPPSSIGQSVRLLRMILRCYLKAASSSLAVGSFVPFLSLLFRLSEYFKEPNAMFDYFHRGRQLQV